MPIQPDPDAVGCVGVGVCTPHDRIDDSRLNARGVEQLPQGIAERDQHSALLLDILSWGCLGSSKYGVHEGRSDGLSGQDSLLSIVQMRAGVPVATDAIDGAKNAGLLGAPIVGAGNPRVLDRVARFKRNLEAMVLKKVEKMARGELT